MKIDSSDFRVREGDEVSLQKWPTDVTPVYKSKHQYKELLEEHVVKLSALQNLLYASKRTSAPVVHLGRITRYIDRSEPYRAAYKIVPSQLLTEAARFTSAMVSV
jgi:hypothetical protein